MWFAISEAGMDPVSRLTNTLLAGGRGRSGVEVGPDQIRVSRARTFSGDSSAASVREAAVQRRIPGRHQHLPRLPPALVVRRLRNRRPGHRQGRETGE